jgi:uncharacterized OB-fold protein
MAGVKPSDIKYASIYDSFTITVVIQIEDLGFAGEGGSSSDGNLISGVGKLPFNTDGGGRAQPSGQPRRHDQSHRGGPAGARRARRCGSRTTTSCWRTAPAARWRRARGLNRHSRAGVIIMSEKVYAAVPPTPGAEPYWEGAKAGKLLVKWCQDCKKPHHYPRGVCPHCLSTNLEWKQAKGTGEVYTYSIMHAAKPAYVIAYVTLDEGVTMMTNIVDVDPAKVKVGQKVKVVFKPSEGEGKLACFTPV